MRKPIFSVDAQKDIVSIQEVSLREYGEDGVIRYTKLIEATLRHLLEEGIPPFGATEQPLGYYSYQLRNLRKQVSHKGVQVKRPCHLIFFKITDDTLYVARILHDSWDFPKHLEFIDFQDED